MDTAIVTGAFTLGGVLVGGLINATVTWLHERGRRRSDARVGALLVSEEPMRKSIVLMELGQSKRWGTIAWADHFARREHWDELRGALGRVLTSDAWIRSALSTAISKG